jgi:2,4-dienoyl-CoA reductase (NADPH2)
MARDEIFRPFELKPWVKFKNRILRSSIGGRTAYYDGTVNNAWANFELGFAEPKGNEDIGVGGIISATLTVDPDRWAPLEYPAISRDEQIGPLREAIQVIQRRDCRYIIQIGDPGYQTQTSLLSQAADQASSSGGFDLLYGYRNVRTAMSLKEIRSAITNYHLAAERVRKTGADGVEITASKGYLIHQFLNPAINRRSDEYGGSFERRCRFLDEVVEAVRSAVGDDRLVGVRISARDRNHLPFQNFRWPPAVPFGQLWNGNGLDEMKRVARRLRDLGVDYIHVSNGYGFINPYETPGRLPTDYLRRFTASTAHLSTKAFLRSILAELTPDWLLNMGWNARPDVDNLDDAVAIRKACGLPTIANGGIHSLERVETALSRVELVSMARPLLAVPDLLGWFREGRDPDKPCTRCNRCTVATTLYPLGCYEPTRFADPQEMEDQILQWSGDSSPLPSLEEIEQIEVPVPAEPERRRPPPAPPPA